MNEIVSDPKIAPGKWTIRGVRTAVIAGRFLSGESVSTIALDYGMNPKDVEKAIRFEVAESNKKYEKELRSRDHTASGWGEGEAKVSSGAGGPRNRRRMEGPPLFRQD